MIKEIEIDKIYFRLFDENGVDHPTKIENSPVYNAICGNTEPYKKYHELMVRLGRAKAGYMNTEDFLDFEKKFKYLEPPYENEYVRVKQTGHLYGGWDGAHRISCEKKRLAQRMAKINSIYLFIYSNIVTKVIRNQLTIDN